MLYIKPILKTKLIPKLFHSFNFKNKIFISTHVEYNQHEIISPSVKKFENFMASMEINTNFEDISLDSLRFAEKSSKEDLPIILNYLSQEINYKNKFFLLIFLTKLKYSSPTHVNIIKQISVNIIMQCLKYKLTPEHIGFITHSINSLGISDISILQYIKSYVLEYSDMILDEEMAIILKHLTKLYKYIRRDDQNVVEKKEVLKIIKETFTGNYAVTVKIYRLVRSENNPNNFAEY